MAARNATPDWRFTFEYDVGLWTYGTVQVIKERSTGSLRTCKTAPKSASPPGAVARLRKLQDLKQKHISTMLEVLEDASNIFILSERPLGGDVGEWAARVMEDPGNWLQERAVAEYIRQTLIALACAHASGVRHGDLRPSSLALTSKLPDARVLLCDLGLAEALDPEGTSARWNANPYTAPERLSEGDEGDRADASADLWSVGAVAHALLVGYAPPQEVAAWQRDFIEPRRIGSSWAERSALSHDFVRSLLQPSDDRPTAAAALQHPWFRDISEVLSASRGIGGEAQHALLCYLLAVLLLPELLKPRELRQLLSAFERLDADDDGLISARQAPGLLVGFGVADAIAAAAVGIVDVNGTECLDTCAVACACLIARAVGAIPCSPRPGQQTLPSSTVNMARRLLKCFFQTYSDAAHPDQVVTRDLRKRLAGSAAARDIESKLVVNYNELLANVSDRVDAPTLAQELVGGGGYGTPLAALPETLASDTDAWFADALGLGYLSDLMGTLLSSCLVGEPEKAGVHRKMIKR